ncbi:MAG: efflux RND transporter permease subunit [Candidatus Latescibacteria bacterium]|nr:efflux RND transporter permease subunit [Candidatus Latescibacterota bacterium]
MINKLIETCLENRFLVVLFFLFVIGVGVWALYRTPVDAIPDIGENQVIVFTDWPGRSPKDVEDQITYPLSTNLMGLPGVKTVRSTSGFGWSMVYVNFEDHVDFYWARTRVLEKMSLAIPLMPEGVVPVLGPDATGLGQVFWYTVEGEGYDLGELRSIQDWFIRYQLQAIPGVSEVAGVGGFVKQYQIDVDPNKLLAYNIKLGEVFNSVRSSNVDVGAKVLEENRMEFIIRGVGFIKSVEDVEDIVLGARDGIPIYVKNIATVQLGPDFRRNALDKGGKEAVGGVVIMRYGGNPLEVIKRVKQRIKELEPGLPEGVRIVPFYDRTGLIYNAIDTLKQALILEILVAIVVIFLFLGHFRSTVIVSLILPISILIAFILMYAFRIPSNIMSLSGIAIAIGVMVDAGIVVTENLFRHLAELKDRGDSRTRLETTIEAAKEVGPAIFFSMIIIIVAFIPVFSLVGQSGKLFHPLAFTKTFVMSGAALLAVTLLPVCALFLLRGRLRLAEENRLTRLIMRLYRPVLNWTLRHKIITIVLSLFILAVTIFPASRIGSEFMPPLDEGSILFMPVTLPSASLTEVLDIMGKQDQILKSFPEVEQVVGKLGRAETATDPAPVSMIETVVTLKPREQWRSGLSKDDLIMEMDRALKIPGVTNIWTQPIVNRVDMLSTGIRTQVGVKIFGHDLETLQQLGEQVEHALRDVPGVADLFSEKIVGKPYIEFEIDRRAAARYGVKVADVQRIIMTAVGGMNITTTVEGRERYPVRVRYLREYRDNVDALERILVPTPGGAQIPIGQLTDIRKVMGPAMINSENGLLRAYVLMNIRGRDPVGFVREASRVVAQHVALPPGYFLSWSGRYENELEARKRLRIVVPVALLVIILLLYIKFKSLSSTLLIVLALPFAVVGGIWLQFILGYNFSTAVWVGFIALLGVAVEDGIVMVDFLQLVFRRRGNLEDRQSVRQAILEGAGLRVRPILMTTATTILALLPVMLSTGTGSEIMKPIAVPTIGGMVTATALNLIVVPLVFCWFREREIGRRPD